jgi:hypothetical protein
MTKTTQSLHDITPRFLSEIRGELRDRREARAARRALERELSSYTTPAETDDLLATLRGQEGPDAEEIRGILTRNRRRHELGAPLAS